MVSSSGANACQELLSLQRSSHRTDLMGAHVPFYEALLWMFHVNVPHWTYRVAGRESTVAPVQTVSR